MSGIAGIYNLDGRPVNERVLRAMTDVVGYRGPDGIGHWAEGPVGLGHLQLCTTPESLREHQPLVSADGNYVITCDGRVDNREELLRDLQHLAPVSTDSTDAELFLYAYIVWGPECARRIIGDFAFAVWDAAKRRLSCARDPLGMRQFHYYFDGRKLIFGTEIKQLFRHLDVPHRINETKTGLLLAGSEGDPEATYYEEVFRLPGGHYLEVSSASLAKRSFWEPNPEDRILLADHEEYEEQFLELFQQSVKSHMRSTRPVGVKLSGGLDSSAVTSVAEQLRARGRDAYPELQAFSYAFPDRPEMDESRYVRAIEERYGTPVCWIYADGIKQAIAPSERRFDEPFAIQHEYLHRMTLQKVHASGIRALLTGEGGDEWLTTGGMYLHLCDWARGLRLIPLWSELKPLSQPYRRQIIKVLLKSILPSWLKGGGRRWLLHEGRVPVWMDRQFRRKVHLDDAVRSQPRSRSVYLERQYEMLESRGSGIGLMAAEQLAAEYQIEFRHPFHDLRLVDYLSRIPPQQKFHHGQSKYLLRCTLKGILPESIRERQGKTSFRSLFDETVRSTLTSHYRDLVTHSRLSEMGIVDGLELRAAFECYLQGDGSQRVGLYVFFLVEEWVRRVGPGTIHSSTLAP